jgi:16S rRNA (uracil1498-N3)-methyltransferase
MDWLIEKCTELGVRKFIPVQTDFCQTNPSDLKRNRWARVAQAAMKQCGRSILPEIEKKMKIEKLADILNGPVLFAHPGVKTTVGDALTDVQKKKKDLIRSLSLLVGPEGGFSDDELDLFKQRGFYQVQLGKRRLRSETAALSLIALTLEALGEI